MQLLYTLDRDPGLSFDEVLKAYRKSIEQSYDLYIFTFTFFYNVLHHAEKDRIKRRGKHLPDETDRSFNAHLIKNPLIKSLTENPLFERKLLSSKYPKVDSDIIRNIYYEFAKEESYIAYVTSTAPTNDEHKKMLLAIFKHCYDTDTFCDILEDNFGNWIDDRSLIIGTIKKTIRDLPAEDDLFQKYQPNLETTDEFGLQLINHVYQKNEELEGLIHPTLKNWDADRVAILDMILLKMAVAELIIFQSIPKKVTLNEYLDISKTYSTDKSKDFINGILDRLMKELTKSGKIVKTGRGLVD